MGMKAVSESGNKFRFWRSMTYRLPATYAAMALLVALSLGVVLQSTLRSRFASQERAYLASNAEPMAHILGTLLEQEDTQSLDEQLSFFSFLVRAKVEILDTEGEILLTADIFDSKRFEAPRRHSPDFSIEAQAGNGEGFSISVAPQPETEVVEDSPIIFYPAMPDTAPNGVSAVTFGINGRPARDLSVQVAPSIFGYDISRKDTRSDQIVEQSIVSSDGTELGILRLSEGPAYGVSVVHGIMGGWLLASIVSVALAIIVSWFVSRDVVHPLTALSKTTQQMASGDLSARAKIERTDEFGALSQSFNHMAQRIEETVNTLQQFVSDAAHEINTPITALRTNLELLDSPSDKETLERALGQLRRLENLAKNLLELSRLESAMDRTELEAIDIVTLTQEVAQFHASQADQAGINLALIIPDEPIWVKANGTQLQQAVSNLIHNAIKFTPDSGSIRIQVQQKSGEAQLTIEDTGIGIPEGDLPYLFNRFHRGRNAARYAGNGLGLAIVQAIVHQFDGQIRAENTKDGARFIMRLPRHNIL